MNLPPWLDKSLWTEYVDYREQDIKKPLTDRMMRMAINRLTRLHGEGYSADELLENSMAQGWRGIYIGDCKPMSEKERKDKWNKQLGSQARHLGIVK